MLTAAARVLAGAGLGLALGGCASLAAPNFSAMSSQYARNLQQYTIDMIFTNVIRASLDYPLTFLDIPNINGSGNVSSSPSISGSIAGANGSNLFGSLASLNVNGGLSVGKSFNFSQASLDNAVFWKSFLAQIPGDTIKYFINNRMPKEVILSLVVEEIVITDADGKVRRFYNNPLRPEHPAFQRELYQLLRAGLTVQAAPLEQRVGNVQTEKELQQTYGTAPELTLTLQGMVMRKVGERPDPAEAPKDASAAAAKDAAPAKDAAATKGSAAAKGAAAAKDAAAAKVATATKGPGAARDATPAKDAAPAKDATPAPAKTEALYEVLKITPLDRACIPRKENAAFVASYYGETMFCDVHLSDTPLPTHAAKKPHLQLVLRSTKNVYEYLGEVVAAQLANPPYLVTLPPVDPEGFSKKARESRRNVLLLVHRNAADAKMFATVAAPDDNSYSIPWDDNGYSTTVMSLLSELQTLLKIPGSIPPSPAVLIQ